MASTAERGTASARDWVEIWLLPSRLMLYRPGYRSIKRSAGANATQIEGGYVDQRHLDNGSLRGNKERVTDSWKSVETSSFHTLE